MAFWTKKSDSAATGDAIAPVAKEAHDLFSSHAKSETKGIFDRKTEALVDLNAVLERFGKVRSALGSGTVIQGKLTFDTPVRIDGKLSGEIFSSATLIVGPTGVVDANVEVASLVVLGSVKGVIHATERVEVYSGGSLEGSVITPVLIIEKGCILNGDCKMPQKAAESLANLEGQGTKKEAYRHQASKKENPEKKDAPEGTSSEKPLLRNEKTVSSGT